MRNNHRSRKDAVARPGLWRRVSRILSVFLLAGMLAGCGSETGAGGTAGSGNTAGSANTEDILSTAGTVSAAKSAQGDEIAAQADGQDGVAASGSASGSSSQAAVKENTALSSDSPTEDSSAQKSEKGDAVKTGEGDPVSSSSDTFEDDPEYAVPGDFDQMVDGRTYYTVERISYHSTADDEDKKANVLLPGDYSEDKQYPVLYLLHGGGFDQNHWMGGSPGTIVANLVAEGQAKDMIIVMPKIWPTTDTVPEGGDISAIQQGNYFLGDLQDDLMPYIESHYSVLTGRENTAVAGMCLGGRESLYDGFSIPEKIGYIGAFTPGVDVKDGEWYIDEDFFQLPDEYKDSTYIMINKGLSDNVVGEFPRDYHEILDEHDIPNDFYETAGGHNFQVWKHGLYNFAKRIF